MTTETESPPPPIQKRGVLGRLAADSSTRIALFVSAVAVVIAVGSLSWWHHAGAPAVKPPQPPPTPQVSAGSVGGPGYHNRVYRRDVRAQNRRAGARARRYGGTFVPTPSGSFTPATPPHAPSPAGSIAPSLAVVHPVGQVAQTARPPNPLAVTANREAQHLLTAWTHPARGIQSIEAPGARGAGGPHRARRATDVRAHSGKVVPVARHAKAAKVQSPGAPMVPQGTVDYGVMLTTADSDVPGPVLAEISTGPLRGARLMGSFQTKHDRLVLTFNTAVLHGRSLPIDAIAISPKRGLTAVRGSVNHHYLERYALLFGGAYLEGYGQAYANAGSSTITGTGIVTTNSNAAQYASRAALGTMGQTMAQTFSKDANIPATVVLPSGAGMGLLFLKPVFKVPG
ncbi:MAG: DotG/IcmE/VirB10 family type IV secretion system protein [Acidiferrobacteraceae bacterium]